MSVITIVIEIEDAENADLPGVKIRASAQPSVRNNRPVPAPGSPVSPDLQGRGGQVGSGPLEPNRRLADVPIEALTGLLRGE